MEAPLWECQFFYQNHWNYIHIKYNKTSDLWSLIHENRKTLTKFVSIRMTKRVT